MERCRNCGKEIKVFNKMSAYHLWAHVSGNGSYRYCYELKPGATTLEIKSVAEPFTKNEIVYGILKDL